MLNSRTYKTYYRDYRKLWATHPVAFITENPAVYSSSSSSTSSSSSVDSSSSSSSGPWEFAFDYSINYGTLIDAGISAINKADNIAWILNSVDGIPSLDIDVYWNYVPDANISLDTRIYYDGNVGDELKFKIFNWNSTAFEYITANASDIAIGNVYQDYSFELPYPMTSFLGPSNTVIIKLLQENFGEEGKELAIDYMILTEGNFESESSSSTSSSSSSSEGYSSDSTSSSTSGSSSSSEGYSSESSSSSSEGYSESSSSSEEYSESSSSSIDSSSSSSLDTDSSDRKSVV